MNMSFKPDASNVWAIHKEIAMGWTKGKFTPLYEPENGFRGLIRFSSEKPAIAPSACKTALARRAKAFFVVLGTGVEIANNQLANEMLH
jgi:hypothetical protein